MLKRSLLLSVCIATAATGLRAQDARRVHPPTLTPQKSGTTQLLIAVSPVNPRVVWAAGTGGTYVVTTDGGATWKSGVVPGAENLQFRDVQGVSDRVAYLMSIGNDTNNFQIYKTVDGGAHWTVEFTNTTPNAFYDCFAFWTPDRGVAHSDSVNGTFPDIRTENGRTWESIANNMPPALANEASFSSSGTCVTTQGRQNAWITTGGSTISRILATRDGGDHWSAYDTPLVSNPNAGGFSVAFRDPWHGIVGGGDLTNDSATDAATSNDGGATWTLTKKPPIAGAIFCLSYVMGKPLGSNRGGFGSQAHAQNGSTDWSEPGDPDGRFNRTVVITTETQPNFTSGGAAWSPDEGQTWYALPQVSGYWGVAFANPHAGWFVGNNGQILKISF
jgi:photosystem II stability/assembly factor-like uncharacterized protein